MLIAFSFTRVAAIVRRWFEITPDAVMEHGSRVELRLLDPQPHRGSDSAAQQTVIDDAFWRADLFNRLDRPSNSFSAAPYHPHFNGVEPSDRVWSTELTADLAVHPAHRDRRPPARRPARPRHRRRRRRRHPLVRPANRPHRPPVQPRGARLPRPGLPRHPRRRRARAAHAGPHPRPRRDRSPKPAALGRAAVSEHQTVPEDRPTQLRHTFEWRERQVRWDSWGDGAPVVFRRGTPWSSALWRPFAEALSDQFRVDLWDMPGYGQSCREVASASGASSWIRCPASRSAGLTDSHSARAQLRRRPAARSRYGEPVDGNVARARFIAGLG